MEDLKSGNMYTACHNKQTSRLWLIKDPEVMEKRYAKQREWRENNPDKVKAYRKKKDKKVRLLTSQYLFSHMCGGWLRLVGA